MSLKEAEAILTALVGEYIRPWREWEFSGHRILSRVAVRPIPSISSDLVIYPSAAEDDALLLATITITRGTDAQPVAGVVDRSTRRVWLFSDGKWLTEGEWLNTAPQPQK